MNEVIELAKKCNFGVLVRSEGVIYITDNGMLDLSVSLKSFYKAAKAQGAKEFMQSLGEPVAWTWDDDGVDKYSSDNEYIEAISKYKKKVTPIYALPNTKDEVK